MKSIAKSLGPGIIFAAAAIGGSHLVQSTRAGAGFGFTLLTVVILANLIKYPFFEFGPRYTAATGESLLAGYKRQGKAYFWVFVVFTFLTMMIIQAAVTMVTAGLAEQLFHFGLSINQYSVILLIACAAILFSGHYPLLDRLVKVIMVILAFTTLFSVIAVMFKIGMPERSSVPFGDLAKPANIAFIVALIGWMPAPIEVSVWHSLWIMEKSKTLGKRVSGDDARTDFLIGYVSTTFFAIVFVLLGALVMYSSGESFPKGAIGFCAALVNMYTDALGEWSRPIITIATFSVMFSTTLTVLDAYPRVLERAFQLSKAGHGPHPAFKSDGALYRGWMIIVIIGAYVVISIFLANLKAMIDFATTLSFAIAPVMAYLNLKAVTSKDFPASERPSGAYLAFSWFCLAVLLAFAIFYFI